MSRDATRRRRAAAFVATGFGAGRLPVAPGTWGSLVGVIIALAAVGAVGASSVAPVVLTVAAALLAWLGAATTAAYLEDVDDEDPPEVVIDEIAGQFIATALLAWFFPTPAAAIVSFGLFRFFDILKPWPIRRLEDVGGAWGVMLDDLAAGVAAAAVGFAVLGAIYGV